MTAPSMPSPARVVSSSITILVKQGYTRPAARQAIRDVVVAVGKSDAHFEPWAKDWLRGLWRAAQEPIGSPAADAASAAYEAELLGRKR